MDKDNNTRYHTVIQESNDRLDLIRYTDRCLTLIKNGRVIVLSPKEVDAVIEFNNRSNEYFDSPNETENKSTTHD